MADAQVRGELRLNARVVTSKTTIGRLRGIFVTTQPKQILEIAVAAPFRRQRIQAQEIVAPDEEIIRVADHYSGNDPAASGQTLELRNVTRILDAGNESLGRLDLVSYDPGNRMLKGIVARRGIVLHRRKLVPVESLTELSHEIIRTDVRGWDAVPPYRSDRQIEHDIHSALRHDRQLVSALGGHALTMEAETIDISVHHQWVTLTGNVPWRGLESRAVQIASRVPGVRGVDDELTADDDLDTAVAGRLASDPRTRGERIHVSVRGGRATLEGTVQSAETARVAVEIARQVPGLRGVRSSLTVA